MAWNFWHDFVVIDAYEEATIFICDAVFGESGSRAGIQTSQSR